jgi:hypothetical protein
MSEQDLDTRGKLTASVIDALNQGTRELDPGTLSHLYDSRRQAMTAVHAQHAGQGLLALRQHPVLWGLGLVSLLIVAAWLGYRSPMVQAPAATDTTDLDIQLLTGELPPQVFADWSLVTQENVEAICLTDS